MPDPSTPTTETPTLYTQETAAPPATPEPEAQSFVMPAQPVAEPVTQPQAPPAVPASPPVETGGGDPNPLFDRARELGLDVAAGSTPDQVAEAALAQLTQVGPYAEYGRGLLPYAEQINQVMVERGQQPAQQPPAPEDEWTPAAHFQSKWDVPEWKPQYDKLIEAGMVERDNRTGQFVAAPGFEASTMPFLAGLNEAHSEQTRRWQQIMRGNPYESFYENMREPLERQVTQAVQAKVDQILSERDQGSVLDQFEAKHGEWLYTTDQATGKTSATPAGQKFIDTYQELRDSGISDVQRLLDLSYRMAGPQPAQQAPATPAVPQPATPAVQPPAPEPPATFIDRAKEMASHQPSSGAAPVQSPADAPVVQSQGELSNMFLNEFRAVNGQPAA